MPQPKLPIELAQEALDIWERCGRNACKAAEMMGIPRATAEGRIRTARIIYKLTPRVAGGDAPHSEQDNLRDRVFELEAQLRASKTDTLTDEYVKRQIIKVDESVASLRTPTWALRPIKGHTLPGVPVAMWSDWHAGEVVQPTQINGVNEFNLAIMQDRVRKLVERTIYLLRNHVVNPQYPGIVVNLGGDMLTGDIHEELSETNEKPTLAVLLDLYGVLRWALLTLADEFGAVFVPCVTGNHGRLTKKPRAKGRNFTNLDWLLYQFLAKSFEGDDRVTFYIPDGPDALYRVFGHRYLLTHGDQFRGGDGQIGPIGPITRGNKRKLARNSAINLDYDTMILGHWHQYMPLHRQIVNGSLKGYDEYANQGNFEYEPPIQALWMSHPTHGITFQMPVYLEQHVGTKPESQWVSIKEAA